MARYPIAFSVQEMSRATRSSCGHRYRANVSLARDRGSGSQRLARTKSSISQIQLRIVLLRTRYDEFESDFESFFPHLVEFTQQERSDVISHMARC